MTITATAAHTVTEVTGGPPGRYLVRAEGALGAAGIEHHPDAPAAEQWTAHAGWDTCHENVRTAATKEEAVEQALDLLINFI